MRSSGSTWTNRQAIAVITGVYESARTGRPVVVIAPRRPLHGGRAAGR